jgi:hypothetical protein
LASPRVSRVTGSTFLNHNQARILANAGATNADARGYRLK